MMNPGNRKGRDMSRRIEWGKRGALSTWRGIQRCAKVYIYRRVSSSSLLLLFPRRIAERGEAANSEFLFSAEEKLRVFKAEAGQRENGGFKPGESFSDPLLFLPG
ncbi:unnamed protein product [Prunus armeniaca]|uniref:Uncharacterized protein n=1 Tax=Prunus armeniaca TaxID=36596 RepID=A0A6J5V2S4_PRUAR|nr:unnamed protein product [Prunus armeniaca]